MIGPPKPSLRARIRRPGTTLAWIAMLAFSGGCGDAPPADVPADAVAAWNGGGIVLADVERAFATARLPVCRQARRGGGPEKVLACYRELAERLVLERLVLAEAGEGAVAERIESDPGLRRQVLLGVWTRSQGDRIEIDDDEIERQFKADPDSYRRPAAVQLSNIFRRHRDPARPEETDAFLRRLKERFEAGETFEALAREHSQSETRLRGGVVGRVAEGDLPARLQEVAFALGEGEVSDPVRVRGGAVLLYVASRFEGVEPSFETARAQIRAELLGHRIEQAISERVAGREPPAGSLVLTLDELVSALDADDPERVVLDLAGDRLSVGEFRRLARLGPAERAAGLDDAGRDHLAELYYRQRERRLLAIELAESADPELRRQADEELRRQAIARLVDEHVEDEMGRRADGDPRAVQSYFEDNRHHYQSPLRFKLRVWNLPFGTDPPAELRRMEELRERLVAGELELAAAVDELGGSVEDLGWRELGTLPAGVPQKARTYLLEIGAGGWSVPYQQDDVLHLIHLEEREDPRLLDYEEVGERVREDYLLRFQQELYRRVVEERLAAAGFVFDEEQVRRLLAPEPAEPARERP